jgi:hypothetical protein
MWSISNTPGADSNVLCVVSDVTDGLIGNGFCDGLFNLHACGWDGGDCCASTCESSSSQGDSCGKDGFWCRDPDAADEYVTFLMRLPHQSSSRHG